MSNFVPLDKPVIVTEQVWPNDTVPVISVFNWVYNHKDFIRESIESILTQKTTFPIEIIIHDDASIDGSKEIILEYQEKYSHLFRNLLNKENQWSQGKSVMTPLFEKPRGKYIALTHGDDYWTDSLKLQKQVDFLEKNSDFKMCFHAVKTKDELMVYNYKYSLPPKNVLNFVDLIFKHYIATASLVFLKSALPKTEPEWFVKCPMGDIPLELIIADKGKTMFLPEIMGCYRKHEGGISQDSFQKTKGRKGYLFMYFSLIKFFNFRHCILLSVMIVKHSLGYIYDKFKL